MRSVYAAAHNATWRQICLSCFFFYVHSFPGTWRVREYLKPTTKRFTLASPRDWGYCLVKSSRRFTKKTQGVHSRVTTHQSPVPIQLRISWSRKPQESYRTSPFTSAAADISPENARTGSLLVVWPIRWNAGVHRKKWWLKRIASTIQQAGNGCGAAAELSCHMAKGLGRS